MSEGATEVVVTTPAQDDAPAPVVEDAPDVVVVDTGSGEGGSDDVELGVRLGHLEAAVAMLTEKLGAVEVTAEVAENTAEAAIETAVEAAVEAEEAAEEAEEVPEPPEDDEPTQVHWMHRPAPWKRGD